MGLKLFRRCHTAPHDLHQTEMGYYKVRKSSPTNDTDWRVGGNLGSGELIIYQASRLIFTCYRSSARGNHDSLPNSQVHQLTANNNQARGISFKMSFFSLPFEKEIPYLRLPVTNRYEQRTEDSDVGMTSEKNFKSN